MFHRLTAYTNVLILFLLTVSSIANATPALTDFAGKEQTLAQHTGKGKWLVVMLWASDCHVCNQEAHQYVAFHKQHMAKDATVLGISLDGKSKKTAAEAFIKKHQVEFPNLIGEPEHVAGLYQEVTGERWVGTPTFLVYNPKGELLGQQVGAVPTSIIESFIARESNATPASKAP